MKPNMTESQWLEATTVHEFHLYWTAPRRHRSWRLFGVACCRRAMALSPDARFDALAECAEQFADDRLDWGQVKQLRKVIPAIRRELGDQFGPHEVRHHTLDSLDQVTQQKPYDALSAVHKSRTAFGARDRPGFQAGLDLEEQAQVRLLRDIFGNPFRSVVFDPTWRTSTVLALAKQMYDSRDFTLMPILADSLQDAGCEHADILNHCRDPHGVHVRGCWVVDGVLGKC